MMSNKIGTLVVCDYKSYHGLEGETYCIARKPIDYLPTLEGLVPSQDLLRWALECKRNGTKDWFSEYSFRYLAEALPVFIRDIEIICSRLDSGVNVNLVCWCLSRSECHRYIVENLIKSRGYQTLRVSTN